MRNLCVFILVLLIVSPLAAQTRQTLLPEEVDPRGEADAVICTQNLENYGGFADVRVRTPTITPDDLEQKRIMLARRFVRAQCDIIGVQELLGSEQNATAALDELAATLSQRTGRIFKTVVGPTNNNFLRNAFLYAVDRAQVENRISYKDVVLPRLTEKQRQRYFARGPLEVQFRVLSPKNDSSRIINVVAFHFKSKSGSGGDPSGLQFEPWRMEMAEALRSTLMKRHSESIKYGDQIVILLGDRNSNFDSASARILEGVLTLKDFQGSAPCRLSKRGVPLCKKGVSGSQIFFSALTEDPQTKRVSGTYLYGKTYYWLDDILLPSTSLPFAWQTPASRGDFKSGVLYEPVGASDHALAWVSLNW